LDERQRDAAVARRRRRPQRQRAAAAALADGWLVRFSPGKAKRARCVNAVAAGRLPLPTSWRRRPVFRAAGLPMVVRITPFTQPAGLDADAGGARLRRWTTRA
jgi:hypothetical protein